MKKFISLFICFSFLLLWGQNRSDSIHIAHYSLNLDIINFSEQEISGNAELSVVYKMNGLENIHLDLGGFTIDSILLDQHSVNYEYVGEDLYIAVQNTQISDTQTVKIYYHGTPPRDPNFGGFYFSGNFAYNIGVGMTVDPQCYGRAWYPCIDEFTDKSTYSFHIRTSADKMAVCGGELVQTDSLADNTIRWNWELTSPIPTYLASVAVSNYATYSDTVHCINGVIPIHIYADETHINNVPSSFQNFKTIIRHFEQKFGAYPWQRIGYVGVPFSSGAMEHATNIAYPNFAINGYISYESLAFHEFSHSWFGNYLTCASANTMWINEGFASYSELIADEILDPTLTTFNLNLLNLHRNVLLQTHKDDGDYFALDNVPHSATYGSTSYDKGSLVAHTLRNYMGDSLFFGSLPILFSQNAFGNVNSEEFFQKMSQISGMDLTDFYLGWVNQPGFVHFSVDSIIPIGNQQYHVYMRQRLHHATNFINSNRVDIAFISDSGEMITLEHLQFSGETACLTVTLPFAPNFAIVDPNRKLGDAIIDYDLLLENSGAVNCSEANFRINASSIDAPTHVRVEHNLVAPDGLRSENPDIFAISPNHYWRIEFYPNNIQSGEMHFKYVAISSQFNDYQLLNGYSTENYLLLYRRNPSSDWQIMPRTIIGNTSSGTMVAQYFLPGEYTLAVGNYTLSIEENNKNHKMNLYPNPANHTLYIDINVDNLEDYSLEIIDTAGKSCKSFIPDSQLTQLNVSQLSAGNYNLILKKGKKLIETQKWIKMNY